MITRDEIIKLAKMTRVSLHDDEIPHVMKDINDVLKYVDRLSEVNTDGVDYESLNHHQKYNVMRCDEHIVNQQQRTIILQNAPQKEDDMFVVPPMITRE